VTVDVQRASSPGSFPIRNGAHIVVLCDHSTGWADGRAAPRRRSQQRFEA
jgi:hypothetical protein